MDSNDRAGSNRICVDQAKALLGTNTKVLVPKHFPCYVQSGLLLSRLLRRFRLCLEDRDGGNSCIFCIYTFDVVQARWNRGVIPKFEKSKYLRVPPPA